MQKASVDDPFSYQLARYYQRQKSWKTSLFVSTLIFAGSFAAGSYFVTSRSLDGASVGNDIGVYSGYSATLLSFGIGALSFYGWSKNIDAYLETLRLQTQYYNIINPYE
jgi:hypothetical protein